MRLITPTLSICALAAAFTAGALTAQPSRPDATQAAPAAAVQPEHTAHGGVPASATSDAGAGGAVTTDDAVPTAAPVITISGFAFDTPTVAAGQTVEVVNLDSAPHTVTANDGSFSVFLDAGATTSFVVPSTPGSYAFFCEVHPSMTSTLVVT